MKNDDETHSIADSLNAKSRRLDMQHLQAIEDNPLDAEDVAMFEMFEREGWSDERRRQYILEQALKQKDRDLTTAQ